MSAFATTVSAWIAAHPGWTWMVAFLVAASEAVVVVGALVPGTPILMAIGAAASLGHTSLWGVVAAAVAGAVVGDGLSYWLGHRHRNRLLRGWPFATRPALLARGEGFFRRWGALGVAAARFLPGVRAVVPVIAGMLGMGPATFYLANILSALVWAPVHILPGALVGVLARLHLPPDWDDLALPAAAGLGALLWGVHRVWRGKRPRATGKPP
ncbi:DedA family protein [Roseomonas sp. E05]|uniref:DedA family protein n=1 Tax=Roseomonas sp. E05 TaxID=3046310 RepID=UPI0024BA1F6A|nr:DedA family protein [Roseomonas sp. E05]MDJ0390289.1 DedA family protein [Roseomonas sp. E05]